MCASCAFRVGKLGLKERGFQLSLSTKEQQTLKKPAPQKVTDVGTGLCGLCGNVTDSLVNAPWDLDDIG